MKKLVVAFLFCVSTIVNAQNPKWVDIDKPISCTNTTTLLAGIKEFEEQISWMGNDPKTGGKFSLFINPKNKSWTLIQFKGDVACILGMGTDSVLIGRFSV